MLPTNAHSYSCFDIDTAVNLPGAFGVRVHPTTLLATLKRITHRSRHDSWQEAAPMISVKK